MLFESNFEPVTFCKIDFLKVGDTLFSVGSTPTSFRVVNAEVLKFFEAFPCYNLGIKRKEKVTLVDSKDLKLGDLLLTMGRFLSPILLKNQQQIDFFRQWGMQNFVISLEQNFQPNQSDQLKLQSKFLSAHHQDRTANEENLHLGKNSALEKKDALLHIQKEGQISKFTSKIRAAQENKDKLEKLQKGITTAEEIKEKGAEILQDLFHKGNLQASYLNGTQEIAQSICQNVQENENSANILALLKDHDDYTFRHSVDVANQFLYVLLKMNAYGEDDLKNLTLGALMHDIGKSRIPSYLLTKPGSLTESEWKLMRMHPIYSAEIMKNLNMLPSQIEIGLKHHVKKNNSGYPEGIDFQGMSESARLSVIADVFQSLVTKRPYKVADTAFSALKKIKIGAEDLYDSKLVEIFIRAFGVFPLGSLIRLSSKQSGFVIDNQKVSLRPVVAVCFSNDDNRLQKPEIIDLSLPDNMELEIITALDHRVFFPKNDALTYFLKI